MSRIQLVVHVCLRYMNRPAPMRSSAGRFIFSQGSIPHWKMLCSDGLRLNVSDSVVAAAAVSLQPAEQPRH